MSPRPESKLPRFAHFALFAIGLLWLLASRVGAESAAQGITHALHVELIRPLLAQVFLLILLSAGFTALNWVGTRNGSVRQTNALPVRATSLTEWQKGAALGWTLLLVTIVPMALVGDLHPQFWFAPRAWALALLSLLTILLGTLAVEISFRGFLFKRLISAIGPSGATLLLSGIYALVSTSLVNTTPFSFVVNLMLGLLFSLAYLRTHALWVGWGLRFGWVASMAVLFGLPVAGVAELANVVATNSSGGVGLTGGPYGPEGSFTAVVVLFGAFFAAVCADSRLRLALHPRGDCSGRLPDGCASARSACGDGGRGARAGSAGADHGGYPDDSLVYSSGGASGCPMRLRSGTRARRPRAAEVTQEPRPEELG